MQRKDRHYAFELKSLEAATGEFSGYASVYDVVDAYREVVMPGAFRKTIRDWKSRKAMPPVLWQHHTWEPIGPITEMAEDDHGLRINARLLVDDVPRAREARALLQSKTLQGMSIGFNVKDERYDEDANLLQLKEIDLWEVSIVTFPANRESRVDAVKAAFGDKLPTLQEFEGFLREVGGFTRSQAKAVANGGLARLLREVDSRNGEGLDATSLLAAILGESKPLTTE